MFTDKKRTPPGDSTPADASGPTAPPPNEHMDPDPAPAPGNDGTSRSGAPAEPTMTWNGRERERIFTDLEKAGIPRSEIPDPPTDAWIKDTQRTLREDGNTRLAQALPAAVVKATPYAQSALGREAQMRAMRDAEKQKVKARRGTELNERNQPVKRKFPLEVAVLSAALLLGVAGAAFFAFGSDDAPATAQAQPTTTTPAITPAPGGIQGDPDVGGEASTPTSSTSSILDDPAGTTADPGQATPPTGAESAESGNLGADQALNQARQEGFTTGYNQGAAEGRATGTQEGQQQGYEQGRAKGQTEGMQSGYQKGKTDGQQAGYQEGLNAGRSSSGAVAPVTYPVPTTPTATVRVPSTTPTPARAAPPAVTTPPVKPRAQISMTGPGAAQAPAVTAPRLNVGGAGGQPGAPTGNAPATAGAAAAPSTGSDSQGQGARTYGNLTQNAPASTPGRTGTLAATGAPTPAPAGRLHFTGAPADAPTPAQPATPSSPPTASAATRTAPPTVFFQDAAPTPAPNPSGEARFGPYRPYQRLNAKLITSIIVGPTLPNLPVIARSDDGREWVAVTAQSGPSRRIALTFTELVDQRTNTVSAIQGAAYDAFGVPGLQGKGELVSPDLVRNLIRSAATGVRDYAQAELTATKATTLPNGTVVTERTVPNLWTVVGGRALDVLALPAGTQTFTDVTSLPAGTPLVIVVGAGAPAR